MNGHLRARAKALGEILQGASRYAGTESNIHPCILPEASQKTRKNALQLPFRVSRHNVGVRISASVRPDVTRRLPPPAPKTPEVPVDRVWNGVVAAGAVGAAAGATWTVANIVSQVAQSSGLGLAGAAATSLAAGVVGYLAADLASGFMHHTLDNYATPKTPLLGQLAHEFQAHHYDVQHIQDSSFLQLLSPLAPVLAPALLALGYANPHFAVASAALTATTGLMLGQAIHQHTHDRQAGPVVRFLQDCRVLQKPEDHGAHHRPPFKSNYCFVNGVMNGPLDKVNFWRHWEKAVYEVTGKEPKVWQDPAVKAFALSDKQFPKG